MYIYPSSPESSSSLQSEESAATKIQAGFRGYRVRKQVHQSTKTVNSNRFGNRFLSSNSKRNLNQRQRSNHNNVHTENQMSSTRYEDVDHHVATSGNEEDASKSVEDRSATKIQAGFRGFLVRKKQKMATEAAVKIQAGFRGFRARKELKQT
ncbi:abnormal spindle-like microcephaly-associated protein homolog [Drosophila guanche]|uniref:Blast:Abnormal spindle-like microcephaly-associated protein homolog n=1 Tax=Drosophila guanche TaxID=7266 RepID=A0A3B0JS30_DROGU|nr:abnormal spindle-like microcephaly-associated protein homolog [Drosophila guanche]SPP83212.1 blast:Abnormal spindle-like microcephaly-associated protein homolog [Drosophila guanche]